MHGFTVVSCHDINDPSGRNCREPMTNDRPYMHLSCCRYLSCRSILVNAEFPEFISPFLGLLCFGRWRPAVAWRWKCNICPRVSRNTTVRRGSTVKSIILRPSYPKCAGSRRFFSWHLRDTAGLVAPPQKTVSSLISWICVSQRVIIILCRSAGDIHTAENNRIGPPLYPASVSDRRKTAWYRLQMSCDGCDRTRCRNLGRVVIYSGGIKKTRDWRWLQAHFGLDAHLGRYCIGQQLGLLDAEWSTAGSGHVEFGLVVNNRSRKTSPLVSSLSSKTWRAVVHHGHYCRLAVGGIEARLSNYSVWTI